MPLGWAVILYPLMRKFKKAWPFLLALAILLSFALLVAKEIIDPLAPIFDEIFVYFLGIFSGSVILSLLFNFRNKWLTVMPKGAEFSGPTKDNLPYAISKEDPPLRLNKKRLRLRHILKAGIFMEEQGEFFYNRLAEKVTDAKVKNLCHRLAQDEIRHKRLLEDTLLRWLPLPFNRGSLRLFEEELKSRGIFLNPPSADSAEEEMVKYAIGQEEKSADFYLSFERYFPDAWKRMHIQMLVMEERSHANELISSYPQFKNMASPWIS